jgi:hypothetical protein
VEIDIEADEEAKVFLVSQGFQSLPQIDADGIFLEGGLAGLVSQSEEFFDQHKVG